MKKRSMSKNVINARNGLKFTANLQSASWVLNMAKKFAIDNFTTDPYGKRLIPNIPHECKVKGCGRRARLKGFCNVCYYEDYRRKKEAKK